MQQKTFNESQEESRYQGYTRQPVRNRLMSVQVGHDHQKYNSKLAAPLTQQY